LPVFPLQLPVQRPVLPPRHGVLMRRLMLRVKRIVRGLMLLIEVVMHPPMGVLIPVVMRKDGGRKREQARYRHGEECSL